ncbi:ABC transporter CDR4 [Taphrina deformans PYCC 5710]|uniref:ABC transporter CDR4 n=1 Tax=Taphrina deformans (strain PYCC 5710 / ATCC 11124 / CBS 356.35 / IMI 108563 / JCM 9778 / NBRC 8474) TaxID=1097556 RepID=R4XBZ9_TAPDE|nr:ABC transporter CDR4 [Taphrina deformans PYCC 5710]|eukprot:CCG83334.1 ABC transporter CDR4 [Taphrina deformans PYCC 5710]
MATSLTGLGGYNFNQSASAHENPNSTNSLSHDDGAFSSVPRAGERDDQIQELARQYSRTEEKRLHDRSASLVSSGSDKTEVSSNPFAYEKDSALDPHSSNFRAQAFVKSMVHLTKQQSEVNPTRRAGVAFRHLTVVGDANDSDYQKSVGNVFSQALDFMKRTLRLTKTDKFQILRDFEGVVRAGELLVVLGPPGSGCSSFLKTITGETFGFTVDPASELNYQGMTSKQMTTQYKGEAIYTAEVDVHFPNMTVGDTLYFAARARLPRNIPGKLEKKEFAERLRDVVMATFGIGHTINTVVGNDFIRGVSGGERKRVTIAEAAISGAAIQCWDNSTRGLDSANAIEFCKTLRLEADYFDATALVAIYQAPQPAYDLFDKVLVIYEGRQIFFGNTRHGKTYFENLGFVCPDRQTTADFLTSMTSPLERIYRQGFESRAPRSPDEFAAAWKASTERVALLQDIEQFNAQYPFEGPSKDQFEISRKAQKAKRQGESSPYTLSYGQQVKLCLWRGFRRLSGDPSITLFQLFGNVSMGLIVSSVFYDLQPNTTSFFSRGSLLFFAVLLNAFGSALEILTLYAQRAIVEKQARYAFYHPSAEAFASMLTDMPYKITNSILFNTTLYFMSHLRREPGPFFFFLLMSFFLTMAMSMLFRTIASVSRTFSQAMTPAALLILGIVAFTGFAIPVKYMLGWSRWINYIDLVSYGFEALMVNEFHNRDFACANLVPYYGNLADRTQICNTVGSVAGQAFVNGDAFLAESYGYYNRNKWRNFGIVIVFVVGFGITYLTAAEWIGAKKSKGEVLVFRQGHKPAVLKQNYAADSESGSMEKNATQAGVHRTVTNDVSNALERQTAVFTWSDVCYDIKIKKEDRRILDHVDGWVKPGTLTALMGVSGAGKTTLLDTLATRLTMGVVSGEMLVDGMPCDQSFQRRTGYVQQQDLHLETSTVREALNFSALLRQASSIPKQEKLAYVDEVIRMLDMQDYADAVVGVPGEGLNVEQRKRLTIGVELAAKPDLLLFLDEPTSGLDSQTSWAICDLMEKLKNAGQAILCTVHQPSAMLFQRFDRLLFLAKGGRTIYFGEVGENSHVLTSYFERNGSQKCGREANPAEWMLEVIGAAPGTTSDIDWHAVWKGSPEFRAVKEELAQLKAERPQQSQLKSTKASMKEFAVPLSTQFVQVSKRVFEQYWRTPSYIFAKVSLCVLSSLFVGFVFYNSPNTQQGLQNQLFSIFLLFSIFGQVAQQIMPHFVTQRSLYESRERPSKTYSWIVFMASNILVELPWNALMGVLMFFCFYYPIGFVRNASGAVAERGGLFFLFVVQFMLFASTFTNMIIAGIDLAETGGNISNLLFSLCLIFCGVLATPQSLPGFWIFMYRVSPFTYLVDGMVSVGVANSNVVCSAAEFLNFEPTAGSTCMQYMSSYIASRGGYLNNPDATSACQFCEIQSTNVFLQSLGLNYAYRWRNFGILWAFIIFNIIAAIGIYWLARVPKKPKNKKSARPVTEKSEV